MLGQYEANPQNWRSKDAALFLVTTLASRGSTQRHGTTKISELVNLEEFTTMHVLPELANSNSEFNYIMLSLLYINYYVRLLNNNEYVFYVYS